MKNGNWYRTLGTSVITFYVFLFVSELHSAQDNEPNIPVAIVLPLSHQYDSSVRQLEIGARIAHEHLSMVNPSLANRIDYRVYAHERSLSSIGDHLERAIEDGAKYFIGGELSHETIFMGDLLKEEDAILISPTSTNPNITRDKPFVFSFSHSDALRAHKFAKFVADDLNAERVGVVHNISMAYTDYVSTAFVDAFNSKEENQDKIVYHARFIKGEYDFSTHVRNLKSKDVQVVVSFLYDSEFFKFVSEATRQGYHPIYIGSSSWGGNEHVVKHQSKNFTESSTFRAYRDLYFNSEQKSPLLNRVKDIYDRQPKPKPHFGAWVPVGFDAAWALFQAIQEAEDPTDPQEIQSILSSDRKWEGATTPPYSFGPDGFAQKQLYIYKILGREFKFYKNL